LSSKQKMIIAVFALAMLVVLLISPSLRLQTIPGPEGPTCSLYAVEAYDGMQLGEENVVLSENLETKSIIGQVNPGTWIAWRDWTQYDWLGNKVADWRDGYCWSSPDPHNPVIFAGRKKDATQNQDGITLQVRIQKPTVDEVNRHGDPLGRSPTEIQWYSYETSKTETGNQITWKHYECYVVPVDFVIEMSIRPDSGCKWGAFKEFFQWYVLDTVVWLNAFSEPYGELPKNEEEPEGVTVTAYNYRGAFPIWAWIGTWDPFVVEDENGEKWKSSEIPWDDLDEYLQVWPSFKGTEITLYKEPGWIYDRLFAEDIVKDPATLQKALGGQISGLPDPRFALTVYFPIELVKFGALKQWGGYWIWYWEKFYYPTAYLRIRCLYALWGEWIYLWTKQEAEEQGYEWENRTSTIKYSPSIWDQFWGGLSDALGNWWSNPFNTLWLFFILIVAVVIVVSIFNPGVWAILLHKLSKR